MKDGIRFSLTYQTSRVARMAPTTLRLSAFRSTRTAASAASTSPTDFTRRRSFRLSSSSSCPSRSSSSKRNRMVRVGTKEEVRELKCTHNGTGLDDVRMEGGWELTSAE